MDGASAPSTDPSVLYKHVLKLTDTEYNALLAVAQSCESSVALDDAKAQEIIRQARNRYPGGKVPAGEQVPEVPDSLKTLQNHRDGAIRDAIANLHQQVSATSAQQLDTFIGTHFAPRSNTRRLAIPHQGNAGAAAQANSTGAAAVSR